MVLLKWESKAYEFVLIAVAFSELKLFSSF
jgi:hypothetical protein